MENVGLAGSDTEQGCGSALVSYLLIWHARFHTMFNVSTEPRLIITVNNYRLGWYVHLKKKSQSHPQETFGSFSTAESDVVRRSLGIFVV